MPELHHYLPRVRQTLFEQSVARVATMTNCGERLFRRFELIDGTIHLDPDAGAFGAHVDLGRARRHSTPEQRKNGEGMLSASVEPVVLMRMSSVSSVHMACRLAAFWQGRTRVGIAGEASRLEIEKGRISALIPIPNLRAALGLTAARYTPSFLEPTLVRMKNDLYVHMDVTLSTRWDPPGERARFLKIDARQNVTDGQEIVDVAEAKAAPATVSPAPMRSGRVRLDGITRVPSPPASPVPAAIVVRSSPVTRSDDVVDPPVDDVVTARPAPEHGFDVVQAFDPSRPVDEYDDDEWDALTDEQRDIVRDRDRRDTPPDPWESVPGFIAYLADTMEPVFEDDWSLRDVGRHWYPDIVYPITDPRDPSMMLTVSKPDVIGGPCGTRRAPETHPPCPDHRQVPHRHPFGIWSSEEYEPFRTELRGGSCQAWVAVPGETEIRWCVLPEQYQAAVDVAWAWAEDRRREAERRSPYSGMERMRRDWREDQGYEPGDKSHDDEMPSYLAYE